MSSVSRQIIRQLQCKGVKVLALDFDETILKVHTFGSWTRSASLLAQHVRPSMVSLISQALEDGLHVCVVTFSGQISLIRDVLQLTLPRTRDVSKILIRGSTSDWNAVLDIPNEGKLQHIASAVAELSVQHKMTIEPEQVCLLDDDNNNVDTAKKFGHLAFLVTKGFTLEVFQDYVNQSS
ncbi:uncharacterized protein LOC144441080 [Glandiceps talaboti]